MLSQRKIKFIVYILLSLILSINSLANNVQNNEVNLDLFSDYAETVVKKEITFEYLNSITETYKTYTNYETEILPSIDRAKKYFSGAYVLDPKREFLTNPNSQNVIRRNGDLENYMTNNLKMDYGGTNKQPTGIFGLKGENITIYVTAKNTDKLPKIQFTQYLFHYDSYHEDEYELKIGKNDLTFPDYITIYYSPKPIAGGPIYIINPYSEDEQSEDVKIYIEGGHFFPFYKKGQNENDFYNYLSQYMLLMEKSPNTYMDLMELWGDRVLLTIDAKRGYNTYRDGKGPNYNLEVWDDYLKYLYTFDGIKFDKSEQYYDKRNYWINNNIRHTQSYGTASAFAYHGYVAIYNDRELDVATYANNFTSFGYVFAHEIGHTMDVSERIVNEITNNMESKFADCYLDKVCTSGDYEKNLIYLTPDMDNNLLRYNNGPYWQNGASLFWWQIEILFPGYWGKLDNMYRYSNTNDIVNTEKQVYFSSIITGLNMSYYYERYGFYLKDIESNFVYSKTSQKFQEMMKKLVDNGTITNNILKFWYLSGPTYMYNINNNKADSSSCYKNNKNKINILKILKDNNSYTLYLPTSECQGHLGYEIYENDKVINFTYNTVFIDRIKYNDNYVPKYKIKAYDKLLEYNDISDEKSYSTEKGSQVCIYNNKYYDSIADAVNEIPTGTTETYEIILKKNTYESKIEIKANIKIKLDETISEEISIIKSASGNLFNVNTGKTLTLMGNSENVKLIVDGDFLSQYNSLINSYGTLVVKYTKFINSIVISLRGGAINCVSPGKLYVYDSLFENNKAVCGGAISLSGSSSKGEISNSTFKNNTATVNGGGISNVGTLTISNCLIEDNLALYNGGGFANFDGGIVTLTKTQIINNKANKVGGGIYFDGKTTFKNCVITNNIAVEDGGGIYGNVRYDDGILTIDENSIISNNNAVNGGGLFLYNRISYFKSLSLYDNKADNLGYNVYLADDSSLYLNGKNNKLEGEIFKSSGSNLYVQDEMFSLYQDNKPIIINTNYTEKEILLVKPKDYVISNDDLKLFSSSIGALYLSNNNEILTKINNYTLTYKLGENITEVTCRHGEVITVNYNCPEGKYITKIVDNNGNTYKIGDNITMKSSLTLVIEVEDSYGITLDFLDKKVKYYSTPNTNFYLPFLNKSNDNLGINYWTDAKGNNIFDKVNVTNNNISLSANYEGYYYVKIDYENERLYYNLTKYTEYNETFIIPELNINVPEGCNLSIKYDGNEYKSGEKIFVQKNVNLVVSLIKNNSDTDPDIKPDPDTDPDTDKKSYSNKDPNVLLIIFIIIGCIIVLVAIFFIYRYIKTRKNKDNLDINVDSGLYELKE